MSVVSAGELTTVYTAVVVLKTLTLALGGLITYHAYKAFRRTSSTPLRSLAVGFGLVTLGSLLAGLVDQIVRLPTDVALVVESLLTVAGFAVILYSVYVDQ